MAACKNTATAPDGRIAITSAHQIPACHAIEGLRGIAAVADAAACHLRSNGAEDEAGTADIFAAITQLAESAIGKAEAALDKQAARSADGYQS